MSETLTYDPGTDTVTTENNLTPDEQDSLQVGEELQSQQENLLAGKYKDAQELEKAYVELQRKLGDSEKPSEETTTTESESEPEVAEAESGDSEVAPGDGYLENGDVNYEAVNETYGEQLGGLFKSNGVDPWAISKHFHSNQGTITDDMYQTLENTGLSRAAIDSYLAGRSAQMGYNQESAADVSQAQINDIQSSVGGAEAYKNITSWAGQNLDRSAIKAFDNIVESGDTNAIKMAVAGLKAQYENANGYEGRMLTGKATATAGDVYKSQQQLVQAMSDPRYDSDPAYRQEVIEKLDRSDLNF